jgi:Mg2+/citrate symporter
LLIFAFHIYKDGAETSFILLSAILGVSLGWFLGILATPYDLSEEKRLSEISKVAYGFLTGYLISKIDAVFNALMSTEDLLRKERLWVFAAVLVTALLATLLTTYVNRSYWLRTYRLSRNGNESLDSTKD